jgi:hypothetical protein
MDLRGSGEVDGDSQAADLGSAPRDGSQLASKRFRAAAEAVLRLEELSKCVMGARISLSRSSKEW